MSSVPAMPLHPVDVAAKGFNMLCAQQPWAAERLAVHGGKTIRICLGALQGSFTISSEGLLTKADDAVVPNVTLKIVTERLGLGTFEQWRNGQPTADFVDIQGEAGLAQVVSELARDLRPDPEDALSRWVGDVAAVRLVSGAGAVFRSVHEAVQRLGQNVTEYLAFEDRAIVPKQDLLALTQDHQVLAQRQDSLAKRVEQLNARVDRMSRLPRQA